MGTKYNATFPLTCDMLLLGSSIERSVTNTKHDWHIVADWRNSLSFESNVWMQGDASQYF